MAGEQVRAIMADKPGLTDAPKRTMNVPKRQIAIDMDFNQGMVIGVGCMRFAFSSEEEAVTYLNEYMDKERRPFIDEFVRETERLHKNWKEIVDYAKDKQYQPWIALQQRETAVEPR